MEELVPAFSPEAVEAPIDIGNMDEDNTTVTDEMRRLMAENKRLALEWLRDSYSMELLYVIRRSLAPQVPPQRLRATASPQNPPPFPKHF